jgi:hypothetical protein
MLESWDIRHWLIVAILILVNIMIFGCLALVLMGRVVLPI